MLHYEFAEISLNIFAGYSRILISIPEGQITAKLPQNHADQVRSPSLFIRR